MLTLDKKVFPISTLFSTFPDIVRKKCIKPRANRVKIDEKTQTSQNKKKAAKAYTNFAAGFHYLFYFNRNSR